MPRSRLEDDLYAPLPGMLHYNARYFGDMVINRTTAHHFDGVDPKTIEWVWIIESKRYATPKEIAQLCPGKPLKV